jgi:hypothetical protein
MWEYWVLSPTLIRGLGYGSLMTCHETPQTDDLIATNVRASKVHQCAASAVVQQRALIRFVEGGDKLHGRGAKKIAERMLGFPAYAIRKDWTTADGHTITKEDIIRAAHPGILDLTIASEQVPEPTPEEIARWTAIRQDASKAA